MRITFLTAIILLCAQWTNAQSKTSDIKTETVKKASLHSSIRYNGRSKSWYPWN